MKSAAVRKARPRPGGRPSRQPRDLDEQAYRQLEEQIVTLRLEPGEFPFRVRAGRRPGHRPHADPRGAAAAGARRPGDDPAAQGILVSETDPRRQLLVLEVRRELERLLCRLGAQRASEAQRARFRQIADGMDRAAKSNDDIAFMRLDRELNLLISEAAHNDYAARAMRFLHGHSRRFWYMHYKAAADLPLCARLHAVQARAIAAGEAKRAAEATDRLIDYTETFTRATVAP
jgi:DNA-binding GntR family transcriptional regulator